MDSQGDIVFLMAMRCEEAGKKIQIRGPRFPSIPRGLSNVGTTCFVDFRVVTGQCQDNIMEMQEEDPGRDEIQITEPRLPKGLQCEQFA